MTKSEVLGKMRGILDLFVTIKDLDDDDGWYLAMHSIRDLAWEGKEIVHAKRLAEYEAVRAPTQKRHYTPTPKLSKEDIDSLLKDLGL